MLVGGRLRRAEVGRGRPVHDAAGTLVGHATAASRADVTDAVAAARAALPAWSGADAHERGRILHAVADLLDEHRDRLGPDRDEAGAAADRWRWHAGWTDKIAGLHGAVHAVAGPYVSWSAPRPVGVVGVIAAGSAPDLVDALAAALAVGATAVVVAPLPRAPAVAGLAEVLAVTELPAGAANLLTGDVGALAAELAAAGVDGLDAGEPVPGVGAGVRVLHGGPGDRGVARLRAWSAVATVWHPVGR
jgi:acyl-CoA reductase-like NAD-dependent aldehyde dehydrogenase